MPTHGVPDGSDGSPGGEVAGCLRVQFQVENYKSIREFGAVATGAAAGSKPCLVFLGELFETDPVRTKMEKPRVADRTTQPSALHADSPACVSCVPTC